MPLPNLGTYQQPYPYSPQASSRETAGGLAPGQTAKQFSGKIDITAGITTALCTPTTGKTYFITDIYLSHDGTTAIDVQMQSGGVAVFRAAVKGDTAPIQQNGIETQIQAVGGAALTIVWPATAVKAYYWISGYEQAPGP